MYLNENSKIYKAALVFATAPLNVLEETEREMHLEGKRVRSGATRKNNAIMTEWLEKINAKLQPEALPRAPEAPGTSSRSRSPRR